MAAAAGDTAITITAQVKEKNTAIMEAAVVDGDATIHTQALIDISDADSLEAAVAVNKK
ncbi:hypothetical protein [Gracilibacillus oryzae]|uniref:hypothetical protein n=1 Tax=Gracilibacillus oryzae TaxID=1672701 RepID=UPI0012952866|nr:hypothetical protein [Gracilibacillus oryzae]